MTQIIDRNTDGYYTINGELKLSITTLFKKVFGMPEGLLKNYFCKICKATAGTLENGGAQHAYADRTGKANYGTEFHDKAHRFFFNAGVVEITYKLLKIKKEYESRGIVPLEGEIVVYDNKSAGRCDFIGINKDKKQLWIVDYKTGSEDKAKEVMQISKYGDMFKSMFPEYKDYGLYGLVFHVGRENTNTIKTRDYSNEQMSLGIEAFNRLLQIYEFMQIFKYKKGE